ncbi:tandem-95 repeat protein [Allosphingosinicella deserti]|uniref:Cadherin domain-containing protein n=1 Tax=Allosphingosinicella deserti TaxID=2116704 RepID=A0A2P7QLP4_9SPHN|nr:tandem-95 repeat protein [Sphingomonas deserti]PSJ38887.1 hypothetical protein C7I55_16330 [Sphingomonas deserti]
MPSSSLFPDQQLWIAGTGGGEAIIIANGDSTVSGGTSGYSLSNILAGNPNLNAPRDIVLDTVNDRFFFVDSDISSGDNRIYQGSISQVLANPGAPALTILYEDNGTDADASMRTLSVDTENDILYFDNGTTFNKIVYDVPLQTATVLADLGPGNYITQVTIDYLHGEVYLASSVVDSFFGVDFVQDNFVYQATGLTASSSSLAFNQLVFEPDDGAYGDPDIPPIPGGFPVEHGTIRGIDIDPVTRTLYITTGTVNVDSSTDQDFSEITTYPGGIFSYAVTANPAGAYTTVFQQDGVNGPTGQLYYAEVDGADGVYYVVDETNGQVWQGSTAGGTPTLFATLPAGMIPQGLELVSAPTLAGVSTGAATAEAAGPGSGQSSAAAALGALDVYDLDTAGQTDQLAGARVRISAGFGSAPGQELLTINGATSGTVNGIGFSYDAATGVLTLTGIGSFDDYEAALSLVSYSISGDNPDDYGASPTRTLSYQTFDGLLFSDETDAVINVVDINDAPTAPATGSVSTLEGSPAVPQAIGAIDVDSLSLNYAQKPGFEAANGTVSFDQVNGTYTYTPSPNFDGTDSFTILISDGEGGTAEQVITVTVISINDDPTAPPTGSVSTAEDTASAAQTIGAADPDGDTLTYSVKPGFGPANGSVSFDQAGGTYTYTPSANYNGPDGFTILIDDGQGGTAEQVVSVTVTPVNDAPTAPAAGAVATAEDTASAAQAIGASDIEGDTLSYSLKPGFGAAHGNVSFDQVNGTYTYTPGANYNGPDSFTILISDGQGGTAEQVVSVTVTPVNDAPTAPTTGAVTTAEDTASAAQAVNAADVDGDTLTYSVKPGFGAAHGSVSFNQAAGTYIYTPAANYNGSDSFTILVSDGQGGIVEQAIAVTVTPANDAPTGVSGTLSVEEFPNNSTVVGTVVAQDPDSSSFTYTLVNDAGGRFDISTAGVVTVQNGLLIDYEQQSSHTIRVQVNDNQGGISQFDMVVGVEDDHGEFVIGDGTANTMVGGIETDIFVGGLGNDTLTGGGGNDIIAGDNGLFETASDGNDILSGGTGNDILTGNGGNDQLNGGSGQDQVLGGSGNDRIDGGDDADDLTGDSGNDVFVFRKGEAHGDLITDFDGNGRFAGDSIVLQGYAAGTTFSHVGGDVWKINDHGFTEYVTIQGPGTVHSTDVVFVP